MMGRDCFSYSRKYQHGPQIDIWSKPKIMLFCFDDSTLFVKQPQALAKMLNSSLLFTSMKIHIVCESTNLPLFLTKCKSSGMNIVKLFSLQCQVELSGNCNSFLQVVQHSWDIYLSIDTFRKKLKYPKLL